MQERYGNAGDGYSGKRCCDIPRLRKGCLIYLLQGVSTIVLNYFYLFLLVTKCCLWKKWKNENMCVLCIVMWFCVYVFACVIVFVCRYVRPSDKVLLSGKASTLYILLQTSSVIYLSANIKLHLQRRTLDPKNRKEKLLLNYDTVLWWLNWYIDIECKSTILITNKYQKDTKDKEAALSYVVRLWIMSLGLAVCSWDYLDSLKSFLITSKFCIGGIKPYAGASIKETISRMKSREGIRDMCS